MVWCTFVSFSPTHTSEVISKCGIFYAKSETFYFDSSCMYDIFSHQMFCLARYCHPIYGIMEINIYEQFCLFQISFLCQIILLILVVNGVLVAKVLATQGHIVVLREAGRIQTGRKLMVMAWPQYHMIFLWQLEAVSRLWRCISIMFLQAHLLLLWAQWASVWPRHWLRVHLALTHHKCVWCWILF